MSAARFAGQTIIVTGAGRGLGEAIARRFAAEGGAVMLVGRRRAPLEAVAATLPAAGGQASVHAADVARAEQVQAVIDAALARWGHIDVLVNNAGVVNDATPFLELTEAQWDRVLNASITLALHADLFRPCPR